MLQVDGNPPPDEPPDVVEGKVSGYIPLVMIKLPGTPLVGKIYIYEETTEHYWLLCWSGAGISRRFIQ